MSCNERIGDDMAIPGKYKRSRQSTFTLEHGQGKITCTNAEADFKFNDKHQVFFMSDSPSTSAIATYSITYNGKKYEGDAYEVSIGTSNLNHLPKNDPKYRAFHISIKTCKGKRLMISFGDDKKIKEFYELKI
jgi:hypothetical protein